MAGLPKDQKGVYGNPRQDFDLARAKVAGFTGLGEEPSAMSPGALEAYRGSELVGLLSNFLPGKAAVAGAGKMTGGALGMLIGMRGAQRLPETMIHEKLANELKAALKTKRAGEEYRLRSNSGHPLTHTSYEGRPFYEIDDAGLLPRRLQEFDKEVPINDAWKIQDRFQQAYGDELGQYKLLNSLEEPIGTGSFDYGNKLITLGHGPSGNATYDKMLLDYPQLRSNKLKETLAHELGGHFMSRIENVTSGTSPEHMLQVMRDTKAYPQLEKDILRSGFLKDLGSGTHPDDLYDLYSKEIADKGALRQLQSYVQAVKEGSMNPNEALDLSNFFQDSSKNLMGRVDNNAKLHELLNSGFMDKLPSYTRKSAESYGVKNAPAYVKPEEMAQAYGLYRANAGEHMAETIGNRALMSPAERRAEPFYNDADVPVDMIHTVR